MVIELGNILQFHFYYVCKTAINFYLSILTWVMGINNAVFSFTIMVIA